MQIGRDLIHPTDILPESVVATSKLRGWNGLVAEHSIQPPMEIQIPALMEHLILLQLNAQLFGNNKPCQVSRFDNLEFEGQLNRGSIITIPAGVPSFHSWTTVDDTMMLTIKPESLQRVALEACEANPDRVEFIGNPHLHDANIEHLTLLLKGELENENIGGRMYAENIINVLFVHLLRNNCVFEHRVNTFKDGLPKRKLKLIIEHINEHLECDVSLDDLAAVAGMSPFYFARQFKQSTGLAPHQYLINQRIEKSKGLLNETDLTITEISLIVGSCSQSHFSTLFRKIVGVTPKEYRYRQ